MTKEDILREFHDTRALLTQFLRHPIEQIKHVPEWPWPRILITQAILAAICGALSGVLEHRIFFSVISGFFFTPIMVILLNSVSTLFFYYLFQIFENKTVSFRRLYTLIFFANIPATIFSIITNYIPPMTLIGMAFAAILLVVAFTENFHVERRRVTRMIAALYAIFFLIWIMGRIDSMRFEKSWKNRSEVEAPEVELGK